MAYKHSRRHQIIGDISGSDDSNRNTGINFEEDYIGLRTNGTTRFKISGSSGAITFNEAFTFPTSDGNNKQVLSTNGSGVLDWADGGGSSKHYIQGHVEVATTANPANFHNVVSIGASAAANFKSWFINPFAGKIKKVILSVKSNNFNSDNDGNITVQVYKNQSSFSAFAGTAVIAGDNFTQTVNNFESGTTDLNTGTFMFDISIAEGDLLQFKAGKSVGDSKDAVITVIFES